VGCRSTQYRPYDAQLAAAGEDEEDEAEEIDSMPDFVPPELVLLPPEAKLPVSAFREIWGYVVADREEFLVPRLPVSDVGYFGATVDTYGKLTGVPDRRKLNFSGRVHLVVGCDSRSLTHFVLMPGSAERRALIDDLLAAVRNYDGLQINFELVPARAGPAYLSFLAELRAGLGNKHFSVALAARTRKIADDVYDYEKILPLVDRILVMAYDEHWSTSAPGPIASMGWSQRVARYALNTIGTEKLVMGLPFYGRSWGDTNANRAYIYSGIEGIIRDQNIAEIRRENGIPTFKYETPLSVTVYYEDDYSLSARLQMYKNMGVEAVGFWRIGQETPAFWPLIKLETAGN
jgi:spore germination protein YaaH